MALMKVSTSADVYKRQTMPIKAVQQFMLGTVLSNEQQAKETLAAMKAAGYDGIELCGFMIHPIGFVVKLLRCV